MLNMLVGIFFFPIFVVAVNAVGYLCIGMFYKTKKFWNKEDNKDKTVRGIKRDEIKQEIAQMIPSLLITGSIFCFLANVLRKEYFNNLCFYMALFCMSKELRRDN